MRDEVGKVREEALAAVAKAGSMAALEEVRVLFLGKKGRVTSLLKGLGALSAGERPAAGALVNQAREEIEKALGARREQLAARETGERLSATRVDVSLPGAAPERGTRHPLTQVAEEVMAIFRGLGFSPRSGPEIETDYYNFEALNFPPDHPAREMQDTFFVSGDLLLRTHTSGVQVHTMESEKPPLRVVSCGKVYRCDFDVTHSPMFHQIEGFMVDERVTFGDLKGVLTEFLHECFGPHLPVRFRPSFFPFTEPSAEVDIGCVLCGARGCRVCKNTGWLEILGSGMIHPEVFRFAGYEPGRYSGFAFGLGIERVAMLKYGIGDIRLFYENDARFLGQFA
jgi:phenylalanyl-tRNA synthetase alpha chain